MGFNVKGAPRAHASAAITRRQHALILIGLGLGTLLEWYDFQLYSGLSSTIPKEFFPADSAVAQSLSFWMVFALAFVTRPVGAIIFGHIGDRIGRKVSLLISILCMAVPTVLIGCIPSYAAIGIAAPVLLGILRVIQGLAIGGEYGTAVIYAAELAPPGWEGRHGSFIVAFCQGGLLTGEAMVLLMVAICTPAQLAVWGWRVPFLLVILSGSLALLLRLNMPEPLELIARARLQYASGTTSPDSALEAGGAAKGGPIVTSVDAEAAAEEMRRIRHRVPIAYLLRNHLVALILFALVACSAQASVYTVTTWLAKFLRDQGVPNLTTQVMSITALVAKLLGVLLAGWLSDKGMPVCVAGSANAAISAGLMFVLTKVVWDYSPGASVAGPWVMQVVMLGWTGFALALLPTIGTNIFTPDVRASGYNLGYSLTSGLVGGLSPLAVTAIRESGAAAKVFGAAFWTLAAGAVSAAAYLATLFLHPACNYSGAQPLSESQWRVPTFARSGSAVALTEQAAARAVSHADGHEGISAGAEAQGTA